MNSGTLLPQARPAPDTVLAQVNGESITAGDLDAALARAPGELRFEYSTPDAAKELVQSMIDRRLMADAARKAGLDAIPAVAEQLAEKTPDGLPADIVLADAWLEHELARLPPPSGEEISRYYSEHQAAFTVPERVFVTRIVADSEASAARVRGALTEGRTLDAIKEDHAEHMLSAGQLWLQQSPKAPELTLIALQLKPGTASAVMPAGDGFVVLRAERREVRRLRPLEEVRDGIRARLAAEAREEAAAGLRQKLRKNASVTLNDEAIKSYSGASPGLSPAPTPTLQSD